MVTIGASLAFLGFFSAYNSSQKAVLAGNSRLELWLRKNPLRANICGILLLILSVAELSIGLGLGIGIALFFVFLMTFGSLIVLLWPLKILRPAMVFVFFLLSFSVELLSSL